VVPALVALDTSTTPSINQLAFKEHKSLHGKHETLVERGYMDGVRRCFLYQRDVVGDGAGASTNPFVAKLRPLYDIVKDGSRKVKKKLLDNIVKSVDFDASKINVDQPPTHLEYARFAVDNLVFLDYATTDDVYQIVTNVEKLVANTGVTVAHAIETDIFFIKLDDQQEVGSKVIDPQRLKVLSTGAAVLTMLWAARTYLRKAYGLNDNKARDYRIGKVKANDPTMNKAPGRNPNVSTATVWEQIEETAKGLESSSDMIEQCRQFVEILSVDQDFKLAAEGEEEDDLMSVGASNSPDLSGDDVPVPGTPKRKRKGSTDPSDKATKRRRSGAVKPRKRKE
jgi:cohesin loading factor subunit SCC2